MKYANIALFVAAILVSLLLAKISMDLVDMIPVMYAPPAGFETAFAGSDAGLLFWTPIVNFTVMFIGLVFPATVGMLAVAFSEKKIFPRRATFQSGIMIPLGLALAVGFTAIGYSTFMQWGYVYGAVLVYGIYSLMYQGNSRNYTRGEKATAP